MAKDRLYIVAYDISDPKRWRRVFRLMKGHGTWLQLSLFQCRLSDRRRIELAAKLEKLIHSTEDHVLIVDIGPADGAEVAIHSLGKPFEVSRREAVVV